MSASVKRILFQRCKKVFCLTNSLSRRKQYIFTNCTHLNGQGSTKPCVTRLCNSSYRKDTESVQNHIWFQVCIHQIRTKPHLIPSVYSPNSYKTTSDSKCVFSVFPLIFLTVIVLFCTVPRLEAFPVVVGGGKPAPTPYATGQLHLTTVNLDKWQQYVTWEARKEEVVVVDYLSQKWIFCGQSNGCWCYCDVLWAPSCILWPHLDVPDVWAGLELGSSPHGPRSRVVGNIGKGEEEVVIAQLGVAWPAIDRNTLQE